MKTTILLAVLAFFTLPLLAQTASQKPNVDVRRVGARIRCQCGCPDSVATCSMLECHFGKDVKESIGKMQAAGTPDAEIVQALIREHGQKVYLATPNAFGWIIPYAMVGIGLVGVWLFVKRSRKLQPATADGPIEIDDPALTKYKAQIEKDLANLE